MSALRSAAASVQWQPAVDFSAAELPGDERSMLEALSRALRDIPANWSSSRWHLNCQPDLSPELSYGRHRGPARLHSRSAAVAVALYQDPELGWVIPLTRRPLFLRNHGGQICFPGGKIEVGESAFQAATREFLEELGVAPDVVGVCGRLPSQFVYASDFQVAPILMVIRPPGTEWKPNPSEVDQVILMPLRDVIGQPRLAVTVQEKQLQSSVPDRAIAGRVSFRAPAYALGPWRIWGATAIILSHLARCLPSMSDQRSSLPVFPRSN